MSADHTELQAAVEVVRSDLQNGFCTIADVKALRDACTRLIDADEADTRALSQSIISAIYQTREAPHAGQQ